MACTQFEYVQKFEENESLLLNTYIVLRIDGKGFTNFTTDHKYQKPNDKRGLDLMNKCAEKVMQTFSEIFISYGQSDEYSFGFRRDTTLFSRRREKILSCVVSCFSTAFVMNFKDFFPGEQLKTIPMFDGRCVCYPTLQNFIDYFSWRQADCHINNLYNTCFWKMVHKGMNNSDVEKILQDTRSDQKNEILFSEFGINYNQLPSQYRKGSILIQITDNFELKGEKITLKEVEIQQVVPPAITIQQEQIIEPKEIIINSQPTDQNGGNPSLIQESKGEKQEVKEKLSENQKRKKQLKDDEKIPKYTPPKPKKKIVVIYEDLIAQQFWIKYQQFLDVEDI